MTAAAEVNWRAPADIGERRFYFWSAVACFVIAALGFVPTYWVGLASGSLRPHPVIHVHAIALYGWLALHVYQAWLVSQGAVARHRAVGLAGVSLATLATVSFLLVGLHGGLRADAAGYGPEMRTFLIVTLSSAVVFAVLVALAIGSVRRPDVHKRLMLAASVSLLGAPIARWFIVLMAPEGAVGAGGIAAPPPVFVSVPPTLLGNLVLVAAMVFDWRARGRVHPALAWATAAVTAVAIAIVPFSATAAWDAIALAFMALAG